MEYFVIADEDTVLGFRYAGVEGQAVRTSDEARTALATQAASGRAGVIILTDDVANTIRDDVNRLRFGSGMPIVVQVPGSSGPAPGRPNLPALIREALGVRL